MSKNGRFVLVTGGAGYIGSVLVPSLLSRGYRVRVFDKLVFGDEGLAPVADQVEIVQGDIVDFEDHLLEDIDKVIHLAALSNDPTSEFNPEANMAINVEGTRRLAEACVRRGVSRLIFASSCSVYYRRNPYEGILDEGSEMSPTAPYSLSKLKAEQLLRELASPSFCPVMLRKGTVFGAAPRMRYDLVVNTFARDAWDRGRLQVHAGGEMWRPLLDVQDAAEAYINALELPQGLVCAQAFNVSHKNYRVSELAHWMKHVLRDKKSIEVDVQYSDGPLPRSYQVSMSKFRDAFGYQPPKGIAQAVMNLWERFERGECVDFDNPMYYNIAWLKLLTSMQSRLRDIGNVFPETGTQIRALA